MEARSAQPVDSVKILILFFGSLNQSSSRFSRTSCTWRQLYTVPWFTRHVCRWHFQGPVQMNVSTETVCWWWQIKHGCCCFIHKTWGGGLFAQTFYVCFYCWHFLKENTVLRPDSLRQFFCVQRNFASTQHRFFFSLLPTVARFLFYAYWFATFWGEKHESRHIQTLSSSRLPKHSRILENPLWSVAKFGSFFLWMVLPLWLHHKIAKKKKKTPIGPHSGSLTLHRPFFFHPQICE